MTPRSTSFGALLLALLFSASATAWAHRSTESTRLQVVEPALDFALLDQNGAGFTLASLRGKVVVVTFIYTKCNQACPLLTTKMASAQEQLGADFGSRVHFVSISVDPEVDTPAVLRAYAKAHSANLDGWSFLTGTPRAVEDVERTYGAVGTRTGRGRIGQRGRIDHLFVTSLIDRRGNLRVRYLGYRFTPDELHQDLRALLRE
jgi:protein SCO1/2